MATLTEETDSCIEEVVMEAKAFGEKSASPPSVATTEADELEDEEEDEEDEKKGSAEDEDEDDTALGVLDAAIAWAAASSSAVSSSSSSSPSVASLPDEDDFAEADSAPIADLDEEDEAMLIFGLAALLERMAAASAAGEEAAEEERKASGRVEPATCFHNRRLPAISIEGYLARLQKFMRCSPSCFVTGLVYVHRLLSKYPHIVFGPLSSHRLLAAGMILACKFSDDLFFGNTYYCKVFGLELKELKELEHQMLALLDFRLVVRNEEFLLYERMLRQVALAVDEGSG